jgi:hypothetical protein
VKRLPSPAKRLPSPAVLLAVVALSAGRPGDVDRGFDAFFRADNPKAAAKAVDQLLAAQVSFDDAWTRVKAGRRYGQAPTGIQRMPIAADGMLFENTIEVPADYDPARAWRVRVQLHGGIGRAEPEPHRSPNRLAGDPHQIYVYPVGWAGAPWWSAAQMR